MEVAGVPFVDDAGCPSIHGLDPGPRRLPRLVQQVETVAVPCGADTHDLLGVYTGAGDRLLDGSRRALPQQIHAPLGPAGMGIVGFDLVAGNLDLATFQIKDRRLGDRAPIVNAEKILCHNPCPP